ncbi:MAG: glutamine synthetase III [Synergistales bacterium]|nr:glutamine synthetase III [Synergistales bacterium]
MTERPSASFATYVFHRRAMGERLPKEVYEKLIAATEGKENLDSSIAGIVAAAMKEWAIGKGATHYTHWFHPRTEMTAEKHMAFLNLDDQGFPLESFSASELIQSEPDASSLPSGGMRSTFEARGYTAWDPTSPAFVIQSERGGTLCIPSIFLSYDGTPLDMKTPLIKSITALEDRAYRLLKLFGNRGVKRVHATVGAEQEYFLVAEELAQQRPDLIYCGRTVLGSPPPKGQQMEDHYFGSIHPRVLTFMEECEQELSKLGIVIRTRHNEVAPGQFEFAPHFAEANLACDQNQIMMTTMRKIARNHGFRLLLHEKPFSELNGSGKHINFSLQDSEGRNILQPPVGNNQKKSLQFLSFVAALALGLARYGGLLRASIATPGNMHRLGGNEAPPAIMSLYLGELITGLLEEIEGGVPEDFSLWKDLDHGLKQLPAIRMENTDRNRTAPIAFTGNKFEFRAPGAPQSISGPLLVLFAIWSWGIEEITRRIEAQSEQMEIQEATLEALRYATQESRNVRFEGNCYTPEWVEEATRRGLPIAQTTPEGLQLYVEPQNRQLLVDMGIMTDREIFSFYETRLEQYATILEIDMNVLASMVREQILPSLSRHLLEESQLLQQLPHEAPKEVGKAALKRKASLREELLDQVDSLDSLRERCEGLGLQEKAEELTLQALPVMEHISSLCRNCEELVPGSSWPFPRKRDLVTMR